MVTIDRQAGLLRPLHRDQGFTQPGERFADDEVHTFVDLDRELLVEGLAHAVRCRGTLGLVHPGQAEIARDQALLARNFASDSHRRAIQLFEPVLETNRGQFVAAGVKSQRLENIGAGFAEFDVQLAQRLRMEQSDLGSERTRAHPSPLFPVPANNRHRPGPDRP